MNSHLVTAALVAALAAAAASAFIDADETFRAAAVTPAGDPRVGACEPRCAPRPERQLP